MAYVAKEIEGSFYVGKGKSYYPDTKVATFEEAEREAMLWEMKDLYSRAERIYSEGVKKGHFDDDCFMDYLA